MNLTSFSVFRPRDNGRFVTAIGNAAAEGIMAWAEAVLETSQELVPVDTGDLKASGHLEVAATPKTFAVAIVYDEPYSVYVEFGTGIRGAASPGAGEGPYNPAWPGMAAQPYLRPAYDLHRNEAVNMTAEAVVAAFS